MTPNPIDEYSSPSAVLLDTAITAAEKRRILEAWQKDAELMAAAEAENMGGGERPRLREVKLALEELKNSEMKDPF